jgi:acetyltransferase-like isoleucine patch superfamily enzyme
MVRGVAAPHPIGADAVLPARRTAVRAIGSRLRLARARARARGRLTAAGDVWLAPGARVDVAPGAHVELGRGCELGTGSRIEAAAGTVTVGARARIGDRATIAAVRRIDVGDDVLIGDWALVVDADPGFDDAERPSRVQPLRPSPVRIGAGARVAAHATVLAGASVGPGAVVGSYALVAGPVARGAAVAGVPARRASSA